MKLFYWDVCNPYKDYSKMDDRRFWIVPYIPKETTLSEMRDELKKAGYCTLVVYQNKSIIDMRRAYLKSVYGRHTNVRRLEVPQLPTMDSNQIRSQT